MIPRLKRKSLLFFVRFVSSTAIEADSPESVGEIPQCERSDGNEERNYEKRRKNDELTTVILGLLGLESTPQIGDGGYWIHDR